MDPRRTRLFLDTLDERIVPDATPLAPVPPPTTGHGSGYPGGSGSGSGGTTSYAYGSGDPSGSGSGYGDPSGSGSGYGDPSGSGSGSGSGYGDPSGSGSGSGYGDPSGSGSGSGSLIPPNVDPPDAAEIVRRLTADNAAKRKQIDANNVTIADNAKALPLAQADVKAEQTNADQAKVAYDAALSVEAAKNKVWGDSVRAGDPKAVQGPLNDAFEKAKKSREDAQDLKVRADARLKQAQGKVDGLNQSTKDLKATNRALEDAIAKNDVQIAKYSPTPKVNNNSTDNNSATGGSQ